MEAVKWLRKAAEQGETRAQSLLGAGYLAGLGLPQDYMLAYMWLNLAASKESGTTREETAALRDKAAAKLTPGQLLERNR